jgi:sensor histidine kinase YesM
MTPIGFFVAVLAFAFVLAVTYSDSLTDSENALRQLEIESGRKLQTELSLLQSQIKPHFLYNALSAIANVCGKDGKKAKQLILDLAYFMQASFDFSPDGKLTTLENELEYTRKYVNIEKARYGKKIRYEEQIEVPPTLLLPRLIIEPLVENAIRHGISRKKGGGEVRLRICEVPEGIRVEVFDNGVGIPKEKLSDVYSEESKGVGLKNIQDRLTRSGGTGLSTTLFRS